MNKKKTRINLILEIILWLVSIVTIYPMLMVLLTSFKNKGEAAYMNVSLPSEWHPENYITVLEKDFIRSLGNSVFITFISVALIVSLSAFLSFIIVRRDTKGCRIGYKIITLGIIAPFAALPTIQLMQKMGIYGSRIGLCLVYSSLYMPFTTMMFSGFIKGIPKELDEAAIIDGCSFASVLFRIHLPLLKPALSTIGILTFNAAWNSYLMPSIYTMNNPKQQPLMVGIQVLRNSAESATSWDILFAATTLSILPTLLVFAFFNKLMVDGVTSGSVKG